MAGIVSVFGDDSADETKQRVFAVAGVIATESEWSHLRAAWLDRTGGIPFHATDCDADRGHYADKPHTENKALYRDLVQLLVHSKACGFGAALDLAGFRSIYPEIPQEMYYHKAFFETVRFLAFFAKRRFKSAVKFTFDNRVQSNYNAEVIYQVMRNDSDGIPDAPELHEKILFRTPVDEPRIQVGDLYAREVMKYLDHQLGPTRRTRKSMEVLMATRRFGADLFLREYFEDMRRETRILETEDKEFNREKYVQWLLKTHQSDSLTNRFKFLHVVSSRWLA